MKKIVLSVLLITIFSLACACGTNYANNTVIFNKGNAQVIAHRGLSGLEVENTLSAFTTACQHSYYGVEADVRKTADGKFIICHDDNLKRLSGQNIKVEECTLSELLNVVLYDKNGKKDIGERLIDLEGYLSVCKQYSKQAILELKSNFTQDEIAKIVDIVEKLDYVQGVTFISFYYDNLLFVREILPNQTVQFLFSELSDEITEKLIRDKIDVAIAHAKLTESALQTFHNAGLKVNCWTVDDKAVAEKLALLGVDYITTNILE